ncbi:class I SAM-dependent rRNA methyltransferase [Marinobacteraceae bacterium S3BR75-40.1]
MSRPPLMLKKGAEKRVRAGHHWLFSNEIDVKRTPLTAFEAGEQAELQAANGKSLGTVLVNPNTLICARLVARDPSVGLTAKLIEHRLQVALQLRDRVFPQPYYRWLYGDSDGLPGLVIDRYGDTLVVQISVAGMEPFRAAITQALKRLVSPSCILYKNDGKMRQVEGLPSYVEADHGDLPERLTVIENGVTFEVDVAGGQKTGWFYDHRLNRHKLATYAQGCRVLDVFSYAGGWGVQAGVAGAESVTFVDSSGRALQDAAANAERNGLRQAETLQGDAFEVLRGLAADKRRFDIVVMDPPALIPRKRDIKAGEAAYARLNELALRLLDREGLLVSASCSMHLPPERLRDLIRASGRKVDRFLQVIEQGEQGPDHPVLPAMPETAYLKAYFVRSLTGFF